MMTPFGPFQPLVLLDERVDGIGSNFANGRPRLLNGTTFAKLGAACAAGIGISTVKVRGCLPIETPLSKPEGLGCAT
jgi:hypothetical protein